ncbi:MAG: hypothetical protein ABJK11_00615 [Balneola sp.]
MKFILTAILVSIASSINAQSIDLSNSEVEQFLCKKWSVEYMEVQGMKVEPKSTNAFDFSFQKDGVYNLLPLDSGPRPKMHWNYSEKSKSIQLYETDRLMGKIIVLENDRMVILFEKNEEMPFENMKGYFKPTSIN